MSRSRASDGTAVSGLRGLPQHRRELLLWKFAGELDRAEVDAYVRAASQRPCSWRGGREHTGETVAIVGDDGRYHLVRDGLVLCTELAAFGRRFPVADYATGLPHWRRYEWWVDEEGGHVPQTYAEPLDATRQWREVEWTVRLGAARVDPSAVPPAHRCLYVGSRGDWPPYVTGDTPLGWIRQSVRELAGSQCHACGLRTGVIVEHDHRTGWVRGLVCHHCNVWLDVCPHAQGCPWAEYLNDPPATSLALPYPRKAGDTRRTRRVPSLHVTRARRLLRSEED